MWRLTVGIATPLGGGRKERTGKHVHGRFNGGSRPEASGRHPMNVELQPLDNWLRCPFPGPRARAAIVGAVQWRIRPVLPVTKLMGAVAVVVLAVAFAGHDPIRWGIARVAAIALAVWALRDLLAPVRLAADTTGDGRAVGGVRPPPASAVALGDRAGTGHNRTHRAAQRDPSNWSAGDAIYLFSTNDLGALPEDVAASLADLRAGSPSQPRA